MSVFMVARVMPDCQMRLFGNNVDTLTGSCEVTHIMRFAIIVGGAKNFKYSIYYT